ncbi:MAG: polysaccharide deacetylase family protein [Deltaproteobacteria bacterium]|nr:polysaccharide deacetylase family protein [Deltaproteobacteria bacterium]
MTARRLSRMLGPGAKSWLSDAASLFGLYRVAGRRYGGVGLIFALHRVTRPGVPLLWPGYEVAVDQLSRVLVETRRLGFEIVSLDEVHRRLTEGEHRTPFAAFTFDDGYADNLHLALPVFREHRAPLCVYVATGLVERTASYWWGALADVVHAHDHIRLPEPVPGLPAELEAATLPQKRHAYDTLNDFLHVAPPSVAEQIFRAHGVDASAVLDRDLLSVAQVRELAAEPLVTIGAHGVRHRPLSALDASDCAEELAASRRILEGWVQRPVVHLAYPFGGPAACGRREFELARSAGYATAVTTRRGNLFPSHREHLHGLPRREIPLDRLRLRHALYGIESLVRRDPLVQLG